MSLKQSILAKHAPAAAQAAIQAIYDKYRVEADAESTDRVRGTMQATMLELALMGPRSHSPYGLSSRVAVEVAEDVLESRNALPYDKRVSREPENAAELQALEEGLAEIVGSAGWEPAVAKFRAASTAPEVPDQYPEPARGQSAYATERMTRDDDAEDDDAEDDDAEDDEEGFLSGCGCGA